MRTGGSLRFARRRLGELRVAVVVRVTGMGGTRRPVLRRMALTRVVPVLCGAGLERFGAVAGAATPSVVLHSSAARLGRASKKAAADSDFLRRSPRASGAMRHGRFPKIRLQRSHGPDPPSRGRPRRAAEECKTPADVLRLNAARRAALAGDSRISSVLCAAPPNPAHRSAKSR